MGSEGGILAHWLLSFQGGNYAILKDKGSIIAQMFDNTENKQLIEKINKEFFYKIPFLYNHSTNSIKWEFRKRT